jgi:hypothetical protein
MKGFAVQNRHKQKDSHDIYYCIRNYPDGIDTLAEACRPLLAEPTARRGFGFIGDKFNKPDGYGPTSVRHFVEDTQILGERTADQWQQDARRFARLSPFLRLPPQLGQHHRRTSLILAATQAGTAQHGLKRTVAPDFRAKHALKRLERFHLVCP